MFNERNFDILTYKFPLNGMNQEISVEDLPQNFSYVSENIFSDPRGEGRVRFGTKLIRIFDRLPADQYPEIVEAFPFSKSPTEKQIVLYVRRFVLNAIAGSRILNENSFHIPGVVTVASGFHNWLKYLGPEGEVSTKISIEGSTADQWNGTTITISDNFFPTALSADPDVTKKFYIKQPYVDDTVFKDANNKISFDVEDAYADPVLLPLFFHEGQTIKIAVDGDPTYVTIALGGIALVGHTISLIFEENTVPDFLGVVEIFFESNTPHLVAVGSPDALMVAYDFITDSFLDIYEHMDPFVVPRAVTFLNKLVICNGVDRLITWDGTNSAEVVDFVKEQADSFNRIDGTHVSFICTVFDPSKYTAGTRIQLKVYDANHNQIGNTFQTTIVSSVVVDTTITLEVADNLPAFDGQNILELFYADYPPAFSYLFVYRDRIWALGPGRVQLAYREPAERLKVYFQYRANSLTDWFSEEDKQIPQIDISLKHNSPDNLEAIISIEGYLIFAGRKSSQMWQLSGDPIQPANVSFIKRFDVGVWHGNLIIPFVNDTYFVTENGVQSIGTLNVAKQMAATPISAVDPIVKDHVRSTTLSNFAYQSCRSFYYPGEKFFGFKIGFNKVLSSFYDSQAYAWSFLSGDFERATTFLTTLDSALYLFAPKNLSEEQLDIRPLILQYADGTYSEPIYGDQNGEASVDFLVVIPALNLKRRFSNTYYEIRSKYTSTFALKDRNKISLTITGDLRQSFTLSNTYTYPLKGDIFDSVPLTTETQNNATSETEGFRLEIPYTLSINRMKFVSYQFFVIIQGQVFDGPFTFNRLRLFGVMER